MASGSTASVYVESDVCLKSLANPSGVQMIGRQGHLPWPLIGASLSPQCTHIPTRSLVSINSKGFLLHPPHHPPYSPWHDDVPSWTCILQCWWPSSPFPSSGIRHCLHTLQKEEGQRQRWRHPCHGVLGNDRYAVSDTLHQNRTQRENRSDIKCAMTL